MKSVCRLLILLLAIAQPANTIHAQDVEAMMKWAAAESIRYDVVAEYNGDTSIVSAPPNSPVSRYDVPVIDRYELGFDWNPQSMTMVGTPSIRNVPATMPKEMPAGKCGAPRLTGAYDHVEVEGAKTGLAGSNSLQLTIRRSYPAAAFSYPNEFNVCTPANVPAKSETESSGLVVPPGMYFAVPAAVPKNFTVSTDGQTMTVKEGPWTYTYTMRVVK